jgi:hydroxymethylbilane synthase
MHTIRLTGRRSRLSLLQIDRVRQLIVQAFPGIHTELVPVDTRGDQLADIPLQTVEGSDFFTAEVQQKLERNEADIAVHSLKDLSAAHFFGPHHFAVTERDDVRDIALFNPTILEKISRGESILIGTCSPRREAMAVDFLSRALPAASGRVSITVKPIRGNVETRLRKLDEGQYDGTILATAGLNRLLSAPDSREIVFRLLAQKRRMLLPLVECTPAPCQGAIVAEAAPHNAFALQVMEAIGDDRLTGDCVKERRAALGYGSGCDQRFGVTHIPAGGTNYLFAAGQDGHGRHLRYWQGLPEHRWLAGDIFSATDVMGEFYQYAFDADPVIPSTNGIFVSNHRAITDAPNRSWIDGRRVWAAGTRSWLALARAGIWVEGSADALGLESMKPVFRMPVVSQDIADLTVVTHAEAAGNWRRKGWNASSTYSLVPVFHASIASRIASSRFLFWTSFSQYTQYRDAVPANATHACPAGETASMFREAGLEPVIFPTIQSFQSWRQSITILTAGGCG